MTGDDLRKAQRAADAERKGKGISTAGGDDPPAEAPKRKRRRKAKAESADAPAWFGFLIKTDKGAIERCLANAILAMREDQVWQGVLGFSEFAGRVAMLAPAPWEKCSQDASNRDWRDHDDLKAAEWLQRHGVPVGVEIVAQAVETVAGDRPFHPVRDWLEGLPAWDCTDRLDHWLTRFLGVRETGDDGSDLAPYVRAVARATLIQAVARVNIPGCKADSVLILEGRQGIGKSSALKILAGDWFTDQLGDIGSKEAAEQLPGVWLVELAELESMSRAEIGRIKAFLSRSTDRFRQAYGRRVGSFARQCVFAGTTNGDHYLRDPSGARRFWPVECGRIDLDGLQAARDQLWAEAAAAFHSGEDWWLTNHEQRTQADAEQAKRFVSDPWEETIAKHLGVMDRTRTSVAQVLEFALVKPVGMCTPADAKRVAQCLVALGWKRRQVREGGKRPWYYFRVTSEEASSGDEKPN